MYIYAQSPTNCGVYYLINNEKLLGIVILSVGEVICRQVTEILQHKINKDKNICACDDIDVFPGHGGQSSIEYEKRSIICI